MLRDHVEEEIVGVCCIDSRREPCDSPEEGCEEELQRPQGLHGEEILVAERQLLGWDTKPQQ